MKEGTVVYIVVIQDTHADDEYGLYYSFDKAMACAKEEVVEITKIYGRAPVEQNMSHSDDWLFLSSLESGSASVAVRQAYILS